MEKMKLFLVIVLCFIAEIGYAQSHDIIRQGLLCSRLTISPSKMLGENQLYFYLHGNFEGFVSKQISLAGDAYFSMGNIDSKRNIFQANHNVFWGASKHFTAHENDFYIGIQPGFSIVKLDAEAVGIAKTRLGINPVFSTFTGYNFFASKFFHFFIQARLLIGEHNYDFHKNLSEIRISAGLGFNLNAKK